MEESYHDKHGISQFLTDLAQKKPLGTLTDLTPNRCKCCMNTPKEFNKYAERINGCSGILKFGFGEDKLVLKQAFLPCTVLPCLPMA